MSKLTPEKILRNLEHGYVMNRAEQAEAAEYIRRLQEDIKTLGETVIMQAEEIMVMNRQFNMWKGGRL
jgi:hypothetical protein